MLSFYDNTHSHHCVVFYENTMLYQSVVSYENTQTCHCLVFYEHYIKYFTVTHTDYNDDILYYFTLFPVITISLEQGTG